MGWFEKLGNIFTSCTNQSNVTDEAFPREDWQPLETRVKILLPGDLREVKSRALMVTNVQEQLIEQFKKDLPKTKSKFSVGTFLDGCRHDTAWSEYPADIESTATRWHCYRSDTRYAEAFDLLERDDGPVEVVIMIGDHFDDSLQQTIALAQKLHEVKGTRIFALTEASENSQVWRSLTQVSESAGGLALPMPQEDEVGLVVREIVQSVIYGTLGLKKALPAPETPFLLDVRDKITHNDSI